MSIKAKLAQAMPFFIVDNVIESAHFYRDKLGFEITTLIPNPNPLFAIVERDKVGIQLKSINANTKPMPNHTQHEWARWDVYIYTQDPDALFEEYNSDPNIITRPLSDTKDGLRAFEAQDNSGYILCFGRPLK